MTLEGRHCNERDLNSVTDERSFLRMDSLGRFKYDENGQTRLSVGIRRPHSRFVCVRLLSTSWGRRRPQAEELDVAVCKLVGEHLVRA